mmetsp:Transcript_10374/g.15152  ORF Transcript_10374/g.15152 Transcript_10374/m.15152 type:complete len:86 (-) Transcript_10374:698-955(-)
MVPALSLLSRHPFPKKFLGAAGGLACRRCRGCCPTGTSSLSVSVSVSGWNGGMFKHILQFLKTRPSSLFLTTYRKILGSSLILPY